MCSEEVVNLPQGDDNGDTGGKACDNGGGDEGGQLAQMQNPARSRMMPAISVAINTPSIP